MRKLFLSIWLMGLGLGLGYAQTQPQQSSSVEGTEVGSFGDIAALSQQIALSQRKIQAMELQNNLAALEEQQLTGNFPFKVLRIEGFGNTLYAVLTDDKGVMYQVGPGEVFAGQYRVSLIRPSAVGVIDLQARRSYVVPFFLGGTEGVQISEMGENVIVAPPPAAPSVISSNKAVSSSS